ncbi:Hypothetical protein, putative [Bodo saltans]|uniref:Uncharacterized protein n=1 Tax=Bodo saltans TaxID=75058 RepID=A0A0S4JGS3_BODSA|nr:Hypothetical protein, putative [Bodo saltans]|eukprot:CUG89526.1 Hypothetical protein, putative [Bodo saltans]
MADQLAAHGRITSEARRVLSSREVDKTLMVTPRVAAPPTTAAARPKSANPLLVEESETQVRNALLAREIWEREVVIQYASIELRTNVMTPLVNDIVTAERQNRTALRLQQSDEMSLIESSSVGVAIRRNRSHAQQLFVRRYMQPSPPPIPQDSRAASAPSNGRASAPADPAMEILDRYITARQARADSGSFTTASIEGVGPRLGALKPAPPRLYLDLSTSVHLQNQYTYFRRGIEAAELDDRNELSLQFAADAEGLKEVVRRRQHLERLVYWREEREARRLFEDIQLQLVRSLCMTDDEEASVRELIAKEEEIASVQIWESEYLAYCIVELRDMERLESGCREDITEAFHTESALRLVPSIEQLERFGIITEYMEKCERLWWPALGDLRQLHVFSLHVRSKCIAIQRFFRKVQMGLAGWRKTHRSLGEWILQHRSCKRHGAAQKSLSNYQKSLEAQVQAILQEAEDERVEQQTTLIHDERTARLNIETEDQWFRSGFIRRFRTDWIHDIILPKFGKLELQEERARQGVELFDVESSVEELLQWHKASMIVIEAKRMCTQRESLDRLVVLHEEESAFEVIRLAAKESKAAVQQRQEDHLTRQYNDRVTLTDMFAASRHQLVQEEQRELLNTYFLFQRSMMEFYAVSARLSGRLTIFQTWFAGIQELWSQFLLWGHAMYGRQLKETWRSSSIEISSERYLEAAIIEKSALLVSGPDADRYESIQTAYVSEREEIEKRVERQFRGAKTIQTFFRRYLLGKCGRSGMKAHLRLVFSEKRAMADLRRKMASQRNDIAQSKKELEDEIAKCNLESDAEYNDLMKKIENLVEPRRRTVISSEESFIARIMKHNFNGETIDILKCNISDLHQHESYFRTSIFSEWKTDHAQRILKRQVVFEQDVKIRPAQRAWRCYIARQKRKSLAKARFETIPGLHRHGRIQVELDELSAFTLQILAPSAAQKLLHHHVHEFLLGEAITQEELQLRMVVINCERKLRAELLWSAQQHVRYSIIETTERNDRYLLRDVVTANSSRTATASAERLARLALEHERDLFLLRMESRIESVYRSAFECNCSALAPHWVEMSESLNRTAIENESCDLLRWPMEHYETNQRLKLQANEESSRSSLILLYHESNSRVVAEDRQQSIKNWYVWLTGVQENRQRAQIENEFCTLLSMLDISFKETIHRHSVWRSWLTQLEHPAHFAGGAVVSRSSPFLYACIKQEEDLRARTLARQDLGEFWSEMSQQKEYAFASYLNLRLH